MAYSVFRNAPGSDWPLGFVQVANNGTPVNIMVNVDASNNNAPGTPKTFYVNPGGREYPPGCHKIAFQGLKPAANNNGMAYNTGMVYVLRSKGPNNQNAGGPMNRTDPGAMWGVILPGGGGLMPAMEIEGEKLDPYNYCLDADVDGEGALVTLYSVTRP